MIELILPITIAIISLATGHILTRIWDRARPFTVIHNIGQCYNREDLVFVNEKIAGLMTKSWLARSFSSGEHSIIDLVGIFNRLEEYIKDSFNGQDVIRKVVRLLQNCKSDEDVINAIETLFSHSGLIKTMELLVILEHPSLLKPDKDSGREIVKIYESGDKDGAFYIELPGSTFRLGGSFSGQNIISEKLRVLANLLRRGQPEELMTFLKSLSYHMQEQIDISHKIIKLTKPLIDENSCWNIEAVLVNYGKSSLVVWPSVSFEVKDRRPKLVLSEECILTDSDLKPIHQLKVLPPDGSLSIHIITKLRQRDMAYGNLIHEIYQRESGHAAIKFKITHRNRSKPFTFCSEWKKFISSENRGVQHNTGSDHLFLHPSSFKLDSP